MTDLAAAQAALVAALVAGGKVPPGFDPAELSVARAALLRKRAGEVRRRWPQTAAAAGDFAAEFAGWAAGRPGRGALRDGWDFALAMRAEGPLTAAAERELAQHRACASYDGRAEPRQRRWPMTVVRGRGVLVLRIGRRLWCWGRG